MTVITVTEARKTLYRLIDDISDSHDPVYISGKRHGAVLISTEDWNAIKETMYLDAIPGMHDSIKKGLKTPTSKCSETLDW